MKRQLLKDGPFLNSYEFHPIDALTEGTGLPNQYGNRPPRFMAAQNVANTQKVQAVVNEKYATMTQDGYLKMWCAYDPGISVTGELREQEILEFLPLCK